MQTGVIYARYSCDKQTENSILGQVRECNLFADWYYPALTGKRLPEKALKEFQKIWAGLIKKILKMPPALNLLDYHAENIMVHSKGLGLLDFQDARWGNVFYDAVSLIEDERNIIPEFKSFSVHETLL